MFWPTRAARRGVGLAGLSRSKDRYRPRLENLEDRLAPAFDLTLSLGLTANVQSNTVGNVTTFTATAAGANLNVADIVAQFTLGRDVVVSSGTAGLDAGNIAVNAAISYTGLAGRSLTLQSGTGGGLVGNITISQAITSTTALSLRLEARNNLNVNANLDGGAGALNLQADVQPGGAGDNGVGSLLIGAAASVDTSGAILLRGADIDINATGLVTSDLGGVQIRTSLATLPINVGGLNTAVVGVNLTDVELGRITASIQFGDPTLTGNITVTTATPATPAGSGIFLTQSLTGAGQIILNDETTGVALAGGNSIIGLTAGTGGIIAVNPGAIASADISTTGASVLLDTTGPIGAALSPIHIAANANIAQQVLHIGVNARPSGVFLNGLGTLTLSNLLATGGATINAGSSLNLIGSINTGAAATFNLGTASAAAALATLTSGFGIATNAGVSLNGRIGSDDSLQGPNVDSQFTLTGNGTGTFVNANTQQVLSFTELENLLGGSEDDLFLLANASGVVSGLINGGAGLDIFDIGRVDAPFSISSSSGGSFTGIVNGTDFTNIESRGSVGFGVRESGEVLQTLFNLAGIPILSSVHVTAPGVFTKVVAQTFGSSGQSIVFGLGPDARVYAAVLDARSDLQFGWFLVAPGTFTDLAVTTYGTGGAPIVFGLGTNGQIYGAALNTSGGLAFGWFQLQPDLIGPPGPSVSAPQFSALAATNFGAGLTNPIVFGVGLDDSQVYALRLTAAGTPTGVFTLVAPGTFLKVTAASRGDGSFELFGLGINQRVFGAQFNAAAVLQFGWFLTAPGVFNDIVAANANAGVVGGLALATGANLADHRPFFAAIFNANGTINQGWINLAQGLFSSLSTTSGQIVLYGLSAVGTENTNDNINQGFFELNPGPFESLGLAL